LRWRRPRSAAADLGENADRCRARWVSIALACRLPGRRRLQRGADLLRSTGDDQCILFRGRIRGRYTDRTANKRRSGSRQACAELRRTSPQ
jgi:hypothetical protein